MGKASQRKHQRWTLVNPKRRWMQHGTSVEIWISEHNPMTSKVNKKQIRQPRNWALHCCASCWDLLGISYFRRDLYRSTYRPLIWKMQTAFPSCSCLSMQKANTSETSKVHRGQLRYQTVVASQHPIHSIHTVNLVLRKWVKVEKKPSPPAPWIQPTNLSSALVRCFQI